MKHPEKSPRKAIRAQTRDKLLFDSSADRLRQQSTIDEEATRHAALGGFDDEEEAERAHFDSLTTVLDRKSTRLNSSHSGESRMPSSA